MLKAAFNAITRIQSRAAILKRPGTPDIYSPIRISPSNYFRFLRGPEYTTVKGVEYIIPVDSMLGEYSQNIVFSLTPDSGSFKLKFGSLTTGSLSWNSSTANIQTAVRLLTGFENAVVTGSFASGIKIVFSGVSSAPTLGELTDNTLTASSVAVTATFSNSNTAWTKPIKRGDVITDGGNRWAVDEIVDMHDLGARILGYRIRCD